MDYLFYEVPTAKKRIKQENIIEIFKNTRFKIDIVTNIKEVHYLDVTFNLTNGTFGPYKKPNNKLLYIHTSSNHSPQILKQLPNAINERLSHNSPEEAAFNSTKVEYEDAVKKSGYRVNQEYTTKTTGKPKNNRQKNIIWFNPPFNKSFKTNVAKIFFRLLDRYFPCTNRLCKIFNRHTVKVSYSCMENVRHSSNKTTTTMLAGKPKSTPSCNCRKKDDCSMNGNS